MNLNEKRLKAYGAGNIEKSNPNIQKNSSSSEKNEGILLKVPASNRPEGEKGESVFRRVAKFLLIIGTEEASKVLQQIPQEQVEKIVPELASIRSVSEAEKEVILAEFEGLVNRTFENGGKETARTILEKAWGPEKAQEMLEKSAPYVGSKPFEYLNSSPVEKVFLLLNDESVAVQALVLSNLEPKKAAAVINKMDAEAKKNVVLQLANLGSVNPEVMRRVDQAMFEKSQTIQVDNSDKIDGRAALSEILKKMSPGAEQGILDVLSGEDAELGRDLKNRLFTLDDVLNAEERFLQEYLRGKTNLEVVYLIAGKNGLYRKKILDCVSAGRKKEILDEEEINKPVSYKNCEEETRLLISAIRSSYEKGHLIIRGRNDEDFIN